MFFHRFTALCIILHVYLACCGFLILLVWAMCVVILLRPDHCKTWLAFSLWAPSAIHVRFVMNIVTLMQLLLHMLQCCLPFIISQIFCHLSVYLRLAICSSLGYDLCCGRDFKEPRNAVSIYSVWVSVVVK